MKKKKKQIYRERERNKNTYTEGKLRSMEGAESEWYKDWGKDKGR